MINILNTYLTYHSEEKADLFIYNEFNDAQRLFERIKQVDIFTNVYLVDYTTKGNSIEQKVNLLLNRNIMFKGHEPLRSYKNFFIQGGNHFAKILYGQIKKQNKEVKLNYIEDGIGAYLSTSIFPTSDAKQKIIARINRLSMYNHAFSTYYLYQPELSFFEQDKTKRLPAITKGSKTIELIKRLFDLPKPSVLTNKIIYLDQPLRSDKFSFDEYSLFESIKECNVTGKEILVKLHPRSEKNKYGEAASYLETSLPFELFALNTEFHDCVIISPMSTVSFSSAMMFDLPIKTVILSKLLSKESDTLNDRSKKVISEFNLFIERYKKTCNEETIILPNDLNELKESIVL